MESHKWSIAQAVESVHKNCKGKEMDGAARLCVDYRQLNDMINNMLISTFSVES